MWKNQEHGPLKYLYQKHWQQWTEVKGNVIFKKDNRDFREKKKPSVLLHLFKKHISNSEAETKVYLEWTLYFFPQLEILLQLSPKLSS